jgi:membrane fusion protein, multidrug efflux system
MVGCNRSDAPAAAGGMPPPMVTAALAITRDVPLYLEQPVGRAVATELVTIQPQITGMLTARHFDDGADIHKGDLLFEIDPRPFKAALDQAEANLLQGKAALQFAQEDYTRVQTLKGASAMSQEEIDQKKNTMDVADAQVKANEAAVEAAKLNLEYCQIRSPIDGRAGHRLVDTGNVVSSSGPNGGTSMLVIQKVDPIYTDFTITENDLPSVRRYMDKGTLKVEAELPEDIVAAAPPSVPDSTQAVSLFKLREGELIFLDNAVQDGTGTVKLRALIPNADRHFWPGQFVHIRLVLMVKKDAVLIPAQAMQISQKGPFVYVVKADNTAEPHPVVLGQRQGDLVVVESGVEAGDNVIVTGQLQVQPGGKVTVSAPAGAGVQANSSKTQGGQS